MTQTLTIEYTLSDEELDGILEMAGYGCNYWADKLDYKTVDGKLVATIHDAEEESEFDFTKDCLERAIVKIASAKTVKEVGLSDDRRAMVYEYILNPENNVCDADMADWFVQTAVHGEVIYG